MLSLIPVIDLFNGKVVHGKKGDRSGYQPIENFSKLVETSKMKEVVEILAKFGSGMFYIADLDSITKNSKKNYPLLREQSKEHSIQFIIDGGFRKAKQAENLLSNDNIVAIFGTESIISYKEVEMAVEQWGEERIIPSIDLKKGEVLGTNEEIFNAKPIRVMKRFESMGISKSIILELSSVGSEKRIMPRSVTNLIHKTHMAIITGGGIKVLSDIEKWNKTGIKGLLVATALHSGKITLEGIKELQKAKIII